MAGALATVDVQGLAGDEGGRLQVADSLDDVGDGAHPPQRMHGGQRGALSSACIGVAMWPEMALTRIPWDAYSIANDFVTDAKPPLVRAANPAGIAELACSASEVVTLTTCPPSPGPACAR